MAASPVDVARAASPLDSRSLGEDGSGSLLDKDDTEKPTEDEREDAGKIATSIPTSNTDKAQLPHHDTPVDREPIRDDPLKETKTANIESRQGNAKTGEPSPLGPRFDSTTSQKIQNAYDFIIRNEHAIPLHFRISHARGFSFALQSYFRLMDDRLAILEGKSKGDDEVPAPLLAQHSSEKVTTPSLNRVAWPGFKRAYKIEKLGVDEKHAIDVLTGEPVIPHDVWRNRLAQTDPIHIGEGRRWNLFQIIADPQNPISDARDGIESTAQKESSIAPGSSRTLHGYYPSVPSRIRINGEGLRRLLKKVLELDIPDAPVVFIRPFKVLLQYNSRIRSLYEQLRQKFERQSSVSPDPKIQGGKYDKEYSDPDNEDVKRLLNEYGTDQAYKELGCLIEFMDHDLKALSHFETRSATKVAFSDLWHIFQPGVEIITAQKPISAYRVVHVTGGRPYLSPPSQESDESESEDDDFAKPYRTPEKFGDFVIDCYQIDFDGTKFGPVWKSFSIQKYDNLHDIVALSVYPLKFAKDPTEVRETLLKNGQTFLSICKGEHVQYHGTNLHEVEQIDSEIVVDFHAALWDGQDKENEWHKQYGVDFGLKSPASANAAEFVMVSSGGCIKPDCCENDHVFNDLSIDHQRMEDFLTDKNLLTMDIRYLSDDPSIIPEEDLILFPHRLFAFVLKDRKWAVVDINNVKRMPEPTNEAWRSLVLPEGHKEMVYSLVQAHFRERNSSGVEDEMQADLIRGKGKGLIILLHGAPGVGKTSTAECVAELCGKPLYPITCGDLGITAVEVETRLKRIFVQAQKWQCVLLLDEADVFLSERGNDVKHNSLVSGKYFKRLFLRILEYYQGILFLTTNRVGKIDEAFRSRVHISLYYPPLDRRSTIDVFKTNLGRTEKRKGKAMKLRRTEIEEFAKDHYKYSNPRVRWNGRQIRNAFHIAIALAENEAAEKAMTAKKEGTKVPKPTLRARHFEVVEGASNKFDDYLTSVLGMASAEIAKQKSYRRDDWGQQDEREESLRDTRKEISRRKYKRYSYASDSSDQSGDGGEGGSKDARRTRSSDSSNDQSNARRHRRGKRRNKSDTDDSEDTMTATERKRDSDRRSSRDKGLKSR
ncbi:hypothetical protein F5Y04DRAFT_293094 [Hypomontagnella monticulosa]|nr:hypothetical protein F5Y04DRAFT_293094 [Hypomontagnella monticulosa]